MSDNIANLRIAATESLKKRGIQRPNPLQVVEEMKRLNASPLGDAVRMADALGCFSKIFGGSK